jgi:hypothetical protein
MQVNVRETPTRASRILLVTIAVLGLANGGCLIFERETIIVALALDRDEAEVLLLCDGFHVEGKAPSDLEMAEKQLNGLFKDKQSIYYAGPLFFKDFSPEARSQLDEDAKKTHDFFRNHLVIEKATLVSSRQGKLCGCQIVTVRPLKEFVRGLNELISRVFLAETTAAIADKKKTRSGMGRRISANCSKGIARTLLLAPSRWRTNKLHHARNPGVLPESQTRLVAS